MNSYQRITYLLSFLALPCAVQADAIKSLESFIKNTHSSRAIFSQIVLNKNIEIVQEAGGTMEFERPNKFRWKYETPYKQLIIGDGTTVWFYDVDLKQVTTQKLDVTICSSPAALLAHKNTIKKNFDLHEIYLQGELEWIEAKPKIKERSFKSLRLGFTPKGSLRKMILYDDFEQSTVIIFSKIEKNPYLDPEIFKFIPPKNLDVIHN